MKATDEKKRTTRKRDPELMAIVAANIRHFREEKGWTQEDLRKRARWDSKTMVSQLENRQTGVGPVTLRKLAKALGKDPSEFFRKTPPSEPRVARKLVQVALTDLGAMSDGPAIEEQPRPSIVIDKQTVFPLSGLVREPGEIYGTHERVLLPKWPADRVKHDLLWAFVDDESPTAPLEFHDVICIDQDDRPDLSQANPPGVYAVRLEKSVRLCRLEVRAHRLILHDVYRRYVAGQEVLPDDVITIDLRAHPSAIIGRAVWILRPL